MASLTARVISHYRVSILAVVAILVVGLWVFAQMPRSEDPEFHIFNFRVITQFPGADANKVEALVTRELEEAVDELDGIKAMESVSTAGLSLVKIDVEPDHVPEEVVDEVRDRIEEIEADLPATAGRPEVVGFSAADIPVVILSLHGPADYRFLQRWAESIRDDLEAIEEVSAVRIEGLPERRILVDVDPERLSQYRIPLARIRDILEAENAAVPGGQLDVGSIRYLLSNPNEFKELDDIRGTVIGSFAGSVVLVRDVAEVVDGFEDARYRVRTAGRTALLLTVIKRPRTNTVAVASRVRDRLTVLRTSLPEDLRLEVVNDRGRGVAELLGNLGRNALGGGVIVVLVVSLFLGLRQAAVISISIPISVLIAFILMGITEVDLNQVSIFGLVLALGMLVDSSLVVVENIDRQLELGATLFEAVKAGVEQVTMPVLASTLTTVAAFVPLLFLTGNIGTFIHGVPMTVIFSLSASLVVALTIIPLLWFALWRIAPPAAITGSERGARLLAQYTEVAKAALRNRAVTLGLALVVFALTLATIPMLGFQVFPKAEKSLFLINVRLPRAANLEATGLVSRQVEQLLETEEKILNCTANIGRGSPFVYYNEEPERENASYAQILVNLDDGVPVESYVASLRPKLRQIAGASVEPRILEQGPVGGAPIKIRVSGEDLDTLAELALRVRRSIADVPGLVDVRDSLGDRVPRLVLDLDREKAGLLGVDTFSFSRTVFMALNGEQAGRYRTGEEEVPILVRVDPESIRELSDLEGLYLPSSSGDVVPFAEVAAVTEELWFGQIDRRNGRRTVIIEIDVSDRLPDDALRDIQQRLSELELPEGYEIGYGGEREQREESFAGLGGAMLVSLLLIYAILAIQFNSFIQPMVILLTVPFGITGAIIGLHLTGNPFGFMAFLGMVSLSGIIINDSIVLTDFANYLQRVEGRSRYEALLEAGRLRFRPVMLTSITTIAGLTPLAIWGGSLWSPLACAVIFGLVGATVLILVLLPVIYSLLVRQKEGERAYRLLAKVVERVFRAETG